MSCTPDQDASDVLANRALADFDQIPVRHKSCVVGVLERGRLPAGTVAAVLKTSVSNEFSAEIYL